MEAIQQQMVEVVLLDGAAATELHQLTIASDAPTFKLLEDVNALEQYEHLSQLLHINKTFRDKI